MKLKQNDLEHLIDMVQRGEMTADQANVKKILYQRVLLVTCRITAQVRKALNEAVRNGELGHVKKNRHMPEAYFNPTFEYLVAGERKAHERQILAAVGRVCV